MSCLACSPVPTACYIDAKTLLQSMQEYQLECTALSITSRLSIDAK